MNRNYDRPHAQCIGNILVIFGKMLQLNDKEAWK